MIEHCHVSSNPHPINQKRREMSPNHLNTYFPFPPIQTPYQMCLDELWRELDVRDRDIESRDYFVYGDLDLHNVYRPTLSIADI